MRQIVTFILIMGFFSSLFGQTEKQGSDALANDDLRLAYNIMHNISLEECSKYKNSKQFELVENGIFKALHQEDENDYRMTISYELESDETNNQYPLEDILDKYLLHVSDFLEAENDVNPKTFKLELGGSFDSIKKAKEILGKKVFNRDYKADDGRTRVELVIE